MCQIIIIESDGKPVVYMTFCVVEDYQRNNQIILMVVFESFADAPNALFDHLLPNTWNRTLLNSILVIAY